MNRRLGSDSIVIVLLPPRTIRVLNFYHLRQFDRDGRSQYSPVRTVTFSASKFSMKAFPNPTNSIRSSN